MCSGFHVTFLLLLAWECEKNQRCRKADGCTIVCLCPRSVRELQRHLGLNSHSEAGTCSPWWRPGNRESLSPWRWLRCRWPCWRLTVRVKRARRWRSCPERQRARCPHQAARSRIAERPKEREVRGEQTKEPGLTQKHQAYPPPPSTVKGLPRPTQSFIMSVHCNYKHHKPISRGKDYNKNGTWPMPVCTFELLTLKQNKRKCNYWAFTTL